MTQPPPQRWQHDALVDAINLLQRLPDDDPRMRQAINLLDLMEVNWRDALQDGYPLSAPEPPTGRHHRPAP